MTEKNEMNETLLTAKDAAHLLGISFLTFKKFCDQHNIRRVKIGSRVKYSKNEILKIINSASRLTEEKIKFNVLSDASISQIETEEDVFDIRKLEYGTLDPYGVLSLLCEIIDRVNKHKIVNLIVDDSVVCQYLRSIGFFSELESRCKDRVVWDKKILRDGQYKSSQNLIPLRVIKVKHAEKPIVEAFVNLLKEQGFKEDVRSYIGQIMGELADNSMTHSEQAMGDRCCYFLAERFILNRKHDCIIVGIADTGQGIHNSLKRNPKYRTLSDKRAFLESFKLFVSSWPDEAERGKGLVDVLSIAMGNHAYLKIDSCELSLFMDFRNKQAEEIVWKTPISKSKGTRYGLILIDKEFEPIKRENVDLVIQKRSDYDDN